LNYDRSRPGRLAGTAVGGRFGNAEKDGAERRVSGTGSGEDHIVRADTSNGWVTVFEVTLASDHDPGINSIWGSCTSEGNANGLACANRWL
jgi:hypothetical protein